MPLPLIGGLIAAIGGFAGVLVLKEVADFVQIGLIMYQTGQKFKASQSGRTGFVDIDGNVTRVSYGGQVWTMSTEEAAAVAGVAGAGGRGKKPAVVPLHPGASVTRGLVRVAEGEQVGPLPSPATLSRPQAGENATAAVREPDSAQKPFTFREYVAYIEAGKSARGAAAGRGEMALELVRERGRDKLAALDGEIERERIAATVDVARMARVGELQRQRERLAVELTLQEREAESKLKLQREKLAAEDVALGKRFALQQQLDDAERSWKTTENREDRAWRERTTKEMSELVYHQKQYAANAALDRATEAAKRMVHILKWSGLKSYSGVVEFASAFAR